MSLPTEINYALIERLMVVARAEDGGWGWVRPPGANALGPINLNNLTRNNLT